MVIIVIMMKLCTALSVQEISFELLYKTRLKSMRTWNKIKSAVEFEMGPKLTFRQKKIIILK